jgi:Putative heavy-metal-binding
MSFFGNLFGALFGATAPPRDSGQSAQRAAEWEAALAAKKLPSFVEARLAAAGAGKAPWVATMSAAELGLARSKGIRPLAMVSGTCWFHYGYSWTQGHGDGWRQALARLQQEARAVGANAVVDVKMRKIQLDLRDSMDFTLVGTAVRIDGIPAGEHPVVATVPALEFVRLLEAGIVPVGIAIGAQYNFLNPGSDAAARQIETGGSMFRNAALPRLGQFWEGIRRHALAELHKDTERQGNGVLAHTHFGQLFKVEQGNDNPPRFLGRHIIIGTVIDTRRASPVPHDIRTVVDMRDDLSPLANAAEHGHNAYPVREEEGAI